MLKASVSIREDLAMLLKLGEQIRQAYERAEGLPAARAKTAADLAERCSDRLYVERDG
jgi:hypothetical protein